jgi:DNA integrity scanning protein DisA with diadenylate cyclase activity
VEVAAVELEDQVVRWDQVKVVQVDQVVAVVIQVLEHLIQEFFQQQPVVQYQVKEIMEVQGHMV